ncbi:LPS translocon maturation chaperone LptM [Halomonas sp. HK25]|uniref:LPS translocon maturation chaperone LptM n=1 Tax=Halomonas sp. HK25 TaxID=3394321 RepID=UPI0039FBC060
MGRLALASLALSLALVMTLSLAGCGQKGPLTLPDDEQTAEQPGPRDAANAPDDSET